MEGGGGGNYYCCVCFHYRVVAVTPVKASQTSSDELYDLYSKAGPEGTTEGEYYEGGEKLEPPATDLGTDNKGEEGGGGGGGGSKEVSEASVEVKEEMEEELMGGDEGEMESEDKTGVLPEEEARKIVQCLEELKKCLEQARLEIVSIPDRGRAIFSSTHWIPSPHFVMATAHMSHTPPYRSRLPSNPSPPPPSTSWSRKRSTSLPWFGS